MGESGERGLPERRRPVCRARAAVVSGGRVLLARHVHPDGRDFWCFPGGGVEPGESFAAAAVRELREEAGLEVELLGVAWVQDFSDDDACELIFLGRPAASAGPVAAVRLGTDPERAGGEPVLRALEWVPLAGLRERRVLPAALALRLAAGRHIDVLPTPGG